MHISVSTFFMIFFQGVAIISAGKYCNSSSPIAPPLPRSTYPYYVSTSVPELHDELYKKIFQVILDQGLFFNSNVSRNLSPFLFRTPEELRKLIDFNLPETRVSHDELVVLIQKIFTYSPRTSHPFRVDRHGAGLDPQGLLGDWMATAMTSPMATFRDAPVFTLMQMSLTQQIRTLIGYDGKGDGITVLGSSAGNGYAIQLALGSKFPGWKQSGIVEGKIPRVAIFLSEDALFSYEKYCIWEGIGMSACIRVPVDNNGRMNIRELMNRIQKAKAEGKQPIMVVATAGTPVMGAIDPIEEIGKIAKAHGMWLHVDGLAGGSYFLSENLKDKLKGIENSDSFLWSPDKSLSLPAVSAILVSKHENVFAKTFAYGANYLFNYSSLYDSKTWDLGDHTMQTTQRPSILKMWFAVKSKGRHLLGEHLTYSLHLKDFAILLLEDRSDTFRMILPSFDSNQVAFYYIPSQLRNISQIDREKILADTQFTENLKAALLTEGVLSISVDKWRYQRNSFFVMTLRNSVLSEDDVRYMLDIIEYYGERLSSIILQSSAYPTGDGTDRSGNKRKMDFSLIKSQNGSEGRVRPKIPLPVENPLDFVNSPIESLHRDQLLQFINEDLKIGTYFENQRGSEAPLCFDSPAKLLSQFDFSLKNPTGLTTTADLTIFRQIVKHSIHNGHPYFNIHLTEGLDAYSQMSDYVVTAVNTGLVTYEDNPMLTLMEEEVIKSLLKLVGYPGGNGTGLILPGGSASNQIALLLALNSKVPHFKHYGLSKVLNKPPVVFLSEQAHYSTLKGSFFAGIGLNNVVFVKTDERGRMDTEDLEMKILKAKEEDGKLPFFVVATTGTTVLGAVDPISKIADLSSKYNLWLHVDATYGGATLFSNNENRKRSYFSGIERSDSFTINAHKSLGASRLSTCFVTRHASILNQVAPPPSMQEFNNEILYDSKRYDGGITQLFPDRRASVLKLWFIWKAKGRQGLGEHVDYGYDLTNETFDYLKSKNDTYILANSGLYPQLTHINFYYVPPRLRGKELTTSIMLELEKIQINLSDTMIRENVLDLSVNSVPGKPRSLIISLYNSALTFQDVKYMLEVIEYYGKDM